MNNEQAATTATQNGRPLRVSIEDAPLSEATRAILLNHLRSFQDNDLKGVMNDYTGESVLLTQEQTYVGPSEIQAFFMELSVHFPTQKFRFILDKMVVRNELAYIVWHAKTPTLDVSFGTDTFVMKEGKIQQQTFAAQLTFI